MSSMIPHLFSRAAAAAACAATKIHPATITTLKATAVLRKNSFETSLPSSSSSSSSISCRSVGSASTSDNASPVTPKIVFLGPPGVGKGTYAKKIAKMLDIPHVSLGDLLREEVKLGSALGKEVSDLVEKGQLVPDEIVLDILKQFLRSSNGGSGSDNKIGADAESSAAEQEQELFGRAIKSGGGYVLDGFPRTVKQAEALSEFEQVNLVLNLFLREDVLIEKCLGRRICTECNGNYNVADIYRKAEGGKPEIVMPPLSVPESCKPHIVTRKDDTEEIILKRLKIYENESKPLEAFYRERALLLDYEITGGIEHTLPTLSPAVVHGLRS